MMFLSVAVSIKFAHGRFNRLHLNDMSVLSTYFLIFGQHNKVFGCFSSRDYGGYSGMSSSRYDEPPPSRYDSAPPSRFDDRSRPPPSRDFGNYRFICDNQAFCEILKHVWNEEF